MADDRGGGGEGLLRRDLTLGALAFASATTDVMSFLALRQVFTSAMTGNTALLGLAVGQGEAAAVWRTLAALLGFVLGVAAGTLAQGGPDRPRRLVPVLALEALCLGLFVTLWYTLPQPGADGFIHLLIFLSALGMGAQIVAARRVNLPGIPTVVFTSTLATIVTTVTDGLLRRRAWRWDTLRQVAIFATYLAGAVLAGALARQIGVLVLLPLAAVLAALALQLLSPAADD